ncbi:hypothetical protein GCM10017774_02020 [Lentzea cavernae]|uniref:Uncharacterized protein n=1 Tax=Lentzea cavernae TaxID=2020703 RepID=A0ABQ3LY42_9PSEU|nr:hypothetical protein GCM10017774_02020 [Lentzea cavernae]
MECAGRLLDVSWKSEGGALMDKTKAKMKRITIRKVGPVRLTAAACSQYNVKPV